MNKGVFGLFATAAVLCGCSRGGGDLAGTSEQGNAGIAATVYTADGGPARGAAVRIRPSDYVQPLALPKAGSPPQVDLHADTNGFFAIDSLTPGAYAIEVTDGVSQAVLLRHSLDTNDGIDTLDNDTLRPFAAIEGGVSIAAGGSGFVQILGLERLAPVDADGFYSFSDLPGGNFTLHVLIPDSLTEHLVYENVAARSGRITRVPDEGWQFSKVVYLNTTATGAGVSQAVYGFPVLVRLTGENFAFEQAGAGGRDVQMVKRGTGSSPLPFEIERWDTDAGLAEIWVKVDTVFPDSIAPAFVMQWGNPDTSVSSGGKAVFDTAEGYDGVWHLSADEKVLAEDATWNDFDGSVKNVQLTEGVTDGGRLFSGDSSYITMGSTGPSALNFPEDGRFTICAWARADSTADTGTVLSKGDAQYALNIVEGNWRFVVHRQVPDTGREYTESPVAWGAWVHVCGVHDGEDQRLYVNGACVDSTKAFTPDHRPRDERPNLDLGRRYTTDGADPQYFAGALDEVRIHAIAIDTARIKLCYMNQRREDALVLFGQ